MKAIILEVPASLLAERQAQGLDHKDEMWEGVLHMNPPASYRHQRLMADILVTLRPLAEAHGLVVTTDTGVYLADDNYRVPDLVVADPTRTSERGIEGNGARVVIEIASPGDESNDKVPFYDQAGVGDVLIIDRDTCDVGHLARQGDELLTRSAPHWIECLAVWVSGGSGHLTWSEVPPAA